MQEKVICKNCKKEISKPYFSTFKNYKNRKFCSNECYCEYKNKERSRIQKEINLRCKFCGNVIPKFKIDSWNEYKKKKFCGRECYSKYKEKHRIPFKRNVKGIRALSLIDEIDYSILKLLSKESEFSIYKLSAILGTKIRNFYNHLRRMIIFGFIEKKDIQLQLTEAGRLFYEVYREIIEIYIKERRGIPRYFPSIKLIESQKLIKEIFENERENYNK